MDVFTEEFYSLEITKNDVYQAINSFNMDQLHYKVQEYDIHFVQVDDKHAIGIFVDEEVQTDNTLMFDLVKLSKGIIQGDKNTIHKIIGIKRSKEIEFLQI